MTGVPIEGDTVDSRTAGEFADNDVVSRDEEAVTEGKRTTLDDTTEELLGAITKFNIFKRPADVEVRLDKAVEVPALVLLGTGRRRLITPRMFAEELGVDVDVGVELNVSTLVEVDSVDGAPSTPEMIPSRPFTKPGRLVGLLVGKLLPLERTLYSWVLALLLPYKLLELSGRTGWPLSKPGYKLLCRPFGTVLVTSPLVVR